MKFVELKYTPNHEDDAIMMDESMDRFCVPGDNGIAEHQWIHLYIDSAEKVKELYEAIPKEVYIKGLLLEHKAIVTLRSIIHDQHLETL